MLLSALLCCWEWNQKLHAFDVTFVAQQAATGAVTYLESCHVRRQIST